jgi:hypothetical protein
MAGTPFTVAVTGPQRPHIESAVTGEIFLSWESTSVDGQVVSRRTSTGAEVWTRVYAAATDTADSGIAILGGISPIASSFTATGGIDYGTGLLPPGANLARIAP